MCFLKLTDWNITEDLRSSVIFLDHKTLPITTSSSKLNSTKIIFKGWASGKYKLRGFQHLYGVLGQNLASIENYALPMELEKKILSEVNLKFAGDESPTVRLQRIHGGVCVPIHIDMTRHSSLIIPLANHDGSVTQFFKYSGAHDQIIDPLQCKFWKKVEIDAPTLIDTKVPHNVVLTRNTVRLSLTIKWSNTSFNDLVKLS